jgi:tetratricopeptide (TPR) repeat protein
MALEDGQVEQARTLLTEAKSFNPNLNHRLEALVLRSENRRAEAKLLLEGSVDIENITLNAALSLELGKADEAFAKLVGVADTSDTHRLRALAYLMKGDLPSASREIEKALAIAPTWTITCFTAAIVDYYSCLSPNRPLAELPLTPTWGYRTSPARSGCRIHHASSELV